MLPSIKQLQEVGISEQEFDLAFYEILRNIIVRRPSISFVQAMQILIRTRLEVYKIPKLEGYLDCLNMVPKKFRFIGAFHCSEYLDVDTDTAQDLFSCELSDREMEATFFSYSLPVISSAVIEEMRSLGYRPMTWKETCVFIYYNPKAFSKYPSFACFGTKFGEDRHFALEGSVTSPYNHYQFWVQPWDEVFATCYCHIPAVIA